MKNLFIGLLIGLLGGLYLGSIIVKYKLTGDAFSKATLDSIRQEIGKEFMETEIRGVACVNGKVKWEEDLGYSCIEGFWILDRAKFELLKTGKDMETIKLQFGK